MTDSENSNGEPESNDDLYGDLQDFQYDQEITKLEESNRLYKEEVLLLSEKIKDLSERNASLQESNTVLNLNISSMYKTAQAEIKRKDGIIDELRRKIDSMTFRRYQKSATTREIGINTEFNENHLNDEVRRFLKENSASSKKSESTDSRRSEYDEDQRFYPNGKFVDAGDLRNRLNPIVERDYERYYERDRGKYGERRKTEQFKNSNRSDLRHGRGRSRSRSPNRYRSKLDDLSSGISRSRPRRRDENYHPGHRSHDSGKRSSSRRRDEDRKDESKEKSRRSSRDGRKSKERLKKDEKGIKNGDSSSEKNSDVETRRKSQNNSTVKNSDFLEKEKRTKNHSSPEKKSDSLETEKTSKNRHSEKSGDSLVKEKVANNRNSPPEKKSDSLGEEETSRSHSSTEKNSDSVKKQKITKSRNSSLVKKSDSLDKEKSTSIRHSSEKNSDSSVKEKRTKSDNSKEKNGDLAKEKRTESHNSPSEKNSDSADKDSKCKNDKNDKTDKTDKSNKNDKDDKSNKNDKDDKSDKTDKSNKTDKTDKSNKNDKDDKSDKDDKVDKSDGNNENHLPEVTKKSIIIRSEVHIPSKSDVCKSKTTEISNDETVNNKVRQKIRLGEYLKRKSGNDADKKNSNSKHPFDTISPLDALYENSLGKDRNSRFSQHKTAEPTDEDEDEDWTLSFKNERPNIPKPKTLYARRMELKLLGENARRQPGEEKIRISVEQNQKAEEKIRISIDQNRKAEEKEPGEITDDENEEIPVKEDSSFEEQIKAEEKPAEEETINGEKAEEEIVGKDETNEINTENQISDEKFQEIFLKRLSQLDQGTSSCELVESSPIKNNYHLIAISPIKPSSKERILEFIRNAERNGNAQTEVQSTIFSLLSDLSGIAVGRRNELTTPEVKKCREIVDTPKRNDFADKETEESFETEKSAATAEGNVTNVETEPDVVAVRAEGGNETSSATNEADRTPIGLNVTPENAPNVIEEQQKEIVANINKRRTSLRNKSRRRSSANCGKTVRRNKTPETDPTPTRSSQRISSKKTSETIGNRRNLRSSGRMSDSTPRKAKGGTTANGRKRKCDGSDESSSKRKKTETTSTADESAETSSEIKDDITGFEFFKPKIQALKTDEKFVRMQNRPNEMSDLSFSTASSAVDCRMLAVCSKTSVSGISRTFDSETPNKRLEKLKNLVINEQTFMPEVGNNSTSSAVAANKSTELMTPRRMLKNDLMLTDSEDDLAAGNAIPDETPNVVANEPDSSFESSESECSDEGSDSGASDFVDLL